MARPKRKDKTRTVLRTGELQRSDGSYQYSWTDENHKRRYVYSKTLEALRIKEEAIEKDKSDGIKAEARYVTLDDLYELWKDLKRGLKNNTFENYKYIYETFVRRQIGSKRVSTFLKSDIKRFYNYLVDERGLKPATVDGVYNILHLKAFVKGVRGYFSYYLRRFSLCFCLNNAFQPVLSSQTATMVKKHFDFIICFALLNHKNSIRFVFLRMVILGG